MQTITEIRNSALAAQGILDFLWSEWITSEKWPKRRVVYHKFGKVDTEKAIEQLNDAFIIEADPAHDPTLELRLFGILATARGDEYVQILTRFVRFLHDAFQNDPGRETNFTGEEVARETQLSPEQVVALGRILSFHVFEMMNMGYSKNFSDWQCGIPKEFDEIGSSADSGDMLNRILVRRYQPRLPVKVDQRHLALAKMAQYTEAAWSGELWPNSDEEPSETDAIIDVFLSHSSKDRDLATAVIALLGAAVGIPKERVRCTTVEGSKLPLGARTDDRLRTEIHRAPLFVGLLTPASLRSAYVLFEIGARWGDGAFLAGLLAKGALGSSITGPMAGINMLHAHREADVHQFVEDIASKLNRSLAKASGYLNEIRRVCEISIAGDPFSKFDGKRVKARGTHKKDQYFVHQGSTYYLEPSAAQVCDSAQLAYVLIEPEEEEVLMTNPGEASNDVQIRAILSARGLSRS